ADETGKVQFTAWSDFKLKEGEVVKISKGTVKAWRGIPQLNFDERGEVIKIKEKYPSAEELRKTGVRMIAEIAAKGGAVDATVRGVLIEVRDGSGLIMRCQECKRALQKGMCKIHGRVDGYPDLRVKAILDDGSGAVGVVMNRDLSEMLLDTTLDESMQKAKEKMNFDIVKDEMDELLTLKILTVSGLVMADQYGLSMIAKEAQLSAVDVKQEAEKLLVELEAPE
ncbi:MAG: single-stranded DNA-binding protein, partial [Candidatus Thermoplasmatota archaeon]|nr:single-stranded DNA-binding protein [Candidatus Thermoplasmatota archaeon]